MIPPEVVETPIPQSTPRELRQFAGLCVLVFGGLCVTSAVRHEGWPSLGGAVAGGIALLVGVPGLIRPGWVRPVFLAAMTLTRPIGHVVGFVVLAIIYYGLLTPLGLAFRLRGRDLLRLRRRPQASYWVPRGQPVDVRRYLRQFQVSSPAPDPSRARPAEIVHSRVRSVEVPTTGGDSPGAPNDRP